ncbi:MAG TPA: NAD(+) diphosphatase [Thermoanaerobaculia bacterium]|nr:NAD(+) diphosphatase [Thermoanaerobaculia bacterium]
MLDRNSHERVDAAKLLRHPRARLLIGVHANALDLIDIPEDMHDALFLGRVDGAPLFVALQASFDYRAALHALDAGDLAVVATAHHMLQWSRRTRFCSACGTEVTTKNGGWIRVCAPCNVEHFPRLDPVVMVRATHRGRILLARHHAYKQAWSTLAGFVEPGETIEEAAVRELYEETGVVARVEELRYFGSQAWPLPSSLLMAFTVEVADAKITIDESEIIEARFFSKEELEHATVSSTVSLSGRMIADFRA